MGTLVFSDKFTKFHQEFEKVIKNCSKIFYGLSVVFSRMSSDIFFLPKVLWEYHSIQIFVHTIFFFSYSSGHIWPYRSKKNSVRWKTFLYNSSGTKEFLWVKTFMGILWFEVHFRSIFRLCEFESKSCFTLDSISFYAQKLNENQ